MIYFYHIGSYDWDNDILIDYYSHNNYTQKEFEDIVFQVLEEVMNRILEENPQSLCFYNIYFQADDLIIEDLFDELMQEEGFHRVRSQLNGKVIFGKSLDEYDKRFDDLFLNLDIDETCKEKNCNRLEKENLDDLNYLREHCGVTVREHLRTKWWCK